MTQTHYRERVLVVAPTRGDAALTRSLLIGAGLECHICNDLIELTRNIGQGVGAILLTEEAQDASDAHVLVDALGAQPKWSDVPILMLCAAGADSPHAMVAMELLGNVTVLERPVRMSTLVSAIRTAIRARRRQYEIRDHLAELKRGEKARALYAAIVESSEDAIVSKTLDGIILSWNAGAERLFGYPANEAIGRSIVLIIPPDKQDEEISILERLRRGQRIESFETVRVSKFGQRIDVSLTVSPLRDSSGEIFGASKVARDITARKRAEEALRQSEARFRFLAQTVPSIIWTAAPDGAITYANDQWLRYCGLTPDQYANRCPELVVHPDDCHRCIQEWARCLREGHDYEIEVRHRRHDGVYRWFVTRAKPLKDNTGRVVVWFGVTTDIHDQKELQEKLRDADRRKDEFLATLAHELRNPLAPIRNALQIMRLTNDDPEVEEARTIMERQLGHMVRLIDDLLDVSRITRGKLRLHRENVDLAAVIDAAVETARPLIADFGHQLTVDLPSEPIYLNADPVRLAQIFSNLLNNSAKYMDSSGQIWLSASVSDSGFRREDSDDQSEVRSSKSEFVEVRVRDKGVGIPAEALPHIFDMFSQIDRSLEKAQGGLGIGLTLVKRLVEMHGGTIEVHSEGLGKGAEFTVCLPITTAVPTAPPEASEFRRSGAMACRILVVDDNRDVAESMSMMLRLIGCEVRTIYSGLQAIEIGAIFRPDMILLDIGMPELNGYDTARRIREQPWSEGIVLVALTGWGQEEDIRRATAAGFHYHFTKPVKLADLERFITALGANAHSAEPRPSIAGVFAP